VIGFLLGSNHGATESLSAPSSIDPFDDSVARLTIVEDDSSKGATGIVMDDNGHIITRARSVEGAGEIWVSCGSGASSRAMVLASDPISDVAVLKVSSSDGRPTEVGGQPRIGHRVVAVHNVAGGEARIRSGVIGSTGLDLMRADGVMQSGVFVADAEDFTSDDGVVFDDSGRFVGLAIALPTAGRGLAAVSADDVVAIAEQLLRTGHVPHPWLGINGVDLSNTTGRAFDLTGGAEVTSVAQDSPAASAGIRAGDVIVSMQDEPVDRMIDIPMQLGDTAIGDVVRIGVVRQGVRVDLAVTTADRPSTSRVAGQ